MARYYHRRPRFSLRIILLPILAGLAFFAFFKVFPLISTHRFGQFDRFNVVLVSKSVTLVSINPKSSSAVTIFFPDDLFLQNIVHGYGGYSVNKISAVGELDKRGGETLAGTIREYVGVPIDGYWLLSSSPADLKSFFLNPNHLFSGKTNLNLLDRFQFVFALEQIRSDKIAKINLSSAVSPLVLADGSNASTLDEPTLDNLESGAFVEESLRSENLRLEIINSPSYPGLGNRAARILTNIGASVISVDTGDLALPTCQILVSPRASNSQTVRRAKDIFSCQVLAKTPDDRADAKIILGEDYVNWLTK